MIVRISYSTVAHLCLYYVILQVFNHIFCSGKSVRYKLLDKCPIVFLVCSVVVNTAHFSACGISIGGSDVVPFSLACLAIWSHQILEISIMVIKFLMDALC